MTAVNREAAEILEVERAGIALDAVGEAEEQGDGYTVGEHQDNRCRASKWVFRKGDQRRDGEEDVAHVHDGGIP